MKSRKDFGDNKAEAALGVILNDQLLFSLFFQKSDLSIEPTAPQKLMILDNSDRILACTSRNVAKTISLIGRVLRDIATYLPTGDKKDQEILITTPTQAQLDPLINRLISNINREPFIKSLIQESNRGDKPRLLTKTRLTVHGRLEGSCLTGDTLVIGNEMISIDMMRAGYLPEFIYCYNEQSGRWSKSTDFKVIENGEQTVYDTCFEYGFQIKATSGHLFLTKRGWVSTENLTDSDSVMVMTGTWAKLLSKSEIGFLPTYDLQVAPYHNFIANGIVVHNSGTDVNMTGIHPVKIYGDEAAFQNHVNHRSRMAGAMPETKWFYAGVPNGVRTTPFYELDQTKIGNDWSHHKFSMLNSNPLFVQSRKYRNQIIKSFGGKNSPDFITQVLGEWGDEAQSSFPPGSISWTDGIPYFMARCSGADIDRALQTGTLARALNNIPQVRCYRAAIGWDWGYSPDPSTFVLAYQMGENQPWRTYARISLYQVTLPKQVEVLKHLVSVVLGYKHSMISVDNNGAYQTCLSETNKYMFDGRIKLTNQGGVVEIDSDTGTLVTPETKESYDIVNRRKEGKIVKMGRKYWLTEQLRRFMLNSILKTEGVQLELGFDPDLENDFVSTVELKTASGQTIYDVPKQGKVFADQNLDAVRALIDSIVEIERFGQPVGVDYSGMIRQLGWIGTISKQDREDGGIKLPWEV